MVYQTVFQRYELKYIITGEQKSKVLEAMAAHMALDEFGRTTIRNIYFDTENYRLVRHSIAKPAYKEKLRIRSYGQAGPDSTVFVELKKKYKQVVYKRRVSMPEKEAMLWVCRRHPCSRASQISEEIDYFLDYYDTLRPVVHLSYEREAFYSEEEPDFRVTFDDTILCRQCDFSLHSKVYGVPLLRQGMVLLEIKCSGGIPLWMVRALTENHIYKSSFSKYGTAYQNIIFPQLKEAAAYA